MGSNRRYSDKIDAQMNAKIAEQELAPKIVSLMPAQTGADREEPTIPAEPLPVKAWVPISSGMLPKDAVVTAWTKRACRVEWKNLDGSNSAAWLWKGAIEPR